MACRPLRRDWSAEHLLLVQAADWPIISAESLVAKFAGSGTRLFASAKSAADARVLLEALELGVDGVVLQTDDAAEVRDCCVLSRPTVNATDWRLTVKLRAAQALGGLPAAAHGGRAATTAV